jgi:hypothetical protein
MNEVTSREAEGRPILMRQRNLEPGHRGQTRHAGETSLNFFWPHSDKVELQWPICDNFHRNLSLVCNTIILYWQTFRLKATALLKAFSNEMAPKDPYF